MHTAEVSGLFLVADCCAIEAGGAGGAEEEALGKDVDGMVVVTDIGDCWFDGSSGVKGCWPDGVTDEDPEIGIPRDTGRLELTGM